jgi:hypothetical protein
MERIGKLDVYFTEEELQNCAKVSGLDKELTDGVQAIFSHHDDGLESWIAYLHGDASLHFNEENDTDLFPDDLLEMVVFMAQPRLSVMHEGFAATVSECLRKASAQFQTV